MSWPDHGAMPHQLRTKLNVSSQEEVLDFSVNTNPLGPPAELLENLKDCFQYLTYYPDPEQLELLQMISYFTGTEPEQVLAGNGGAELIFTTARLFAGKRVLLIEPAFKEYDKALQSVSADIMRHIVYEENNWSWKLDDIGDKLIQCDAIWLCNPNNPSGISLSQEVLEELIDYCALHQIIVVIDEAFYDFQLHPADLLPYIRNNVPLLLIRSVTKMYAVPALRAGYMLGPDFLISELKELLPAWNVNIFAEYALKYAVSEHNHVYKTAEFVAKERNRFLQKLKELYMVPFPSSVNYFLLRHQDFSDMSALLAYLARSEVHARHTYHFPGLSGRYIRIAVKTKQENDQLAEILQGWCERC
ncbi:pyridoxal phosphate-dependent aminotransferase [Alteribacillus sp. HJP-4]|uniref:pyridoxal phosphate-dependent aminotransferase n=1 Tax=Alteribacillus sp. HJP-4 TaxID=2775394 RepID=UPI0035CCDF29